MFFVDYLFINLFTSFVFNVIICLDLILPSHATLVFSLFLFLLGDLSILIIFYFGLYYTDAPLHFSVVGLTSVSTLQATHPQL